MTIVAKTQTAAGNGTRAAMHFGVSFHFDLRMDWWDLENTIELAATKEMAQSYTLFVRRFINDQLA